MKVLKPEHVQLDWGKQCFVCFVLLYENISFNPEGTTAIIFSVDVETEDREVEGIARAELLTTA